MSTLNVNILHFRKPWVTAWWSAAFPGFGHLLLGNHFKGAILIVWEVLINMQSHINGAMVLSIHGKYKQAALIINPRWVLLYIAVYIYAIWDSYRTTIEQNKVFTLAERENAPIIRFQMNSLAVQYLDLRSPWLAMVWSLLMPGLGQMYLHRIPTGFFASYRLDCNGYQLQFYGMPSAYDRELGPHSFAHGPAMVVVYAVDLWLCGL